MNLDFIEIGTSDFATLIEKCSSDKKGLSIEPIKYYLDKLPNKPNVIKVHGAIVSDELLKEVEIYYVSEENISKYNLGWWLRGCNCVGHPHDLHLQYCDLGVFHSYPPHSIIPPHHLPRNLVEEKIVDVIKVPCYTFKDLVEIYQFNYVDYIKTDTEGMDCDIINSILDYYEISKMDLPLKIQYESNVHTIREDVDKTADRLRKLGYTVDIDYKHDAVATRKR